LTTKGVDQKVALKFSGSSQAVSGGVRHAASRGAHHTLAVRAGHDDEPCELSGAVAGSEHRESLYEFAEPHRVIVGVSTSWIGALSFVSFVDHDVLIYDARLHWLVDYEPTLAVLRALMTLCARHHAASPTYRASAKTAACVGGFISNMGHYF
jgi:hypothetical protein